MSKKCFDCETELEEIKKNDLYACNQCKVIWKNRAYGFELYEKDAQMYPQFLEWKKKSK